MTDDSSFTNAGPCATGTTSLSSPIDNAVDSTAAVAATDAPTATATISAARTSNTTAEATLPALPPQSTEATPSARASPAASINASQSSSSPNFASQENSSSNNNNDCCSHTDASKEISITAHDSHDSNERDDVTHPSQTLHSHRQSHNSSKLPAFRFADRLNSNGAASVSTPALVTRGPPSPVSPNPDPSDDSACPPTTQNPDAVDTVILTDLTTQSTLDHNKNLPASPLTDASPTNTSPRLQASTHPTSNAGSAATAAGADRPTRSKRPTSLPDSPSRREPVSCPPPTSAPGTATAPRDRTWQSRRPAASRSSSDSAVSGGYLSSRSRQRVLAATTDRSTKEGASGRRELLLPKTLSQTSPSNERRDSGSNRPPVSYKPPVSSAVQSVPSTPVRVPPIRGFRSSISRKSLNLDMNFSRPFEFPGDEDDPNHDHTLRALEGRRGSEQAPMTPLASRGPDDVDGDDGGDMFLRIARQESGRRGKEGHDLDDNQSSVSRVIRSSHRRPLSTNVASYQPTSPPQLTRRLSDQQETARSRRYVDDRATEVARSNTYRASPRDKAASAHPGEDSGRLRSTYTSQRPSPLTPRSGTAFQDPAVEGSNHNRRRSSITESNGGSQARTPVFKSFAQQGQTAGSKAYSSSPLIRSFDLNGQPAQDRAPGLEGTESTLSTAAPSTVWDELDDIRSRINRLELTGKLPSTSGAAVSRLSDERPPTATTTVTTVSSSPKRHGTGAAHTEVGSTTSSQREAHPVLHTALTRSRPYISPEVFRSLENAANDAMALSFMMGLPGQPGPISSGGSTIGAGTTITDRQLRRKADSVCRSLTELCVALGEDAPPTKASQAPQSAANAQTDGPSTPVAPVPFSGMASQRRPSVPSEPILPKPSSSPKAMSKFEERRHTLLNGSLLPSPRVSGSTPNTPVDAAPNRRSSLLIGRTRRAGTEEPEDGRASSLLSRTRRAGTEEPDEGRKTSLLVRNRRGTIGEDDFDSRLRAPSRATTEVNTIRGPPRDYSQQASAAQQEVTSPNYSALPRRRLPSNINTSRLATPASAITPPTRRYLDRPAPTEEGNTYHDVHADNRAHRVSMIGQSSLPARTASLSTRRQNRDSTITSISTAATAGGGYN